MSNEITLNNRAEIVDTFIREKFIVIPYSWNIDTYQPQFTVSTLI